VVVEGHTAVSGVVPELRHEPVIKAAFCLTNFNTFFIKLLEQP